MNTVTPLAVRLGTYVPSPVTVAVNGYFYAVDLGHGVQPRHHRVGSNAVCACYLGKLCPAVDLVREHLADGGERAPEPPPGYYPVAPAQCPVCGAEAAYEKSLSSKTRGAGWRCTNGGSAHYWQQMGHALAEKMRRNPWLFPPVVRREGRQVSAWNGVLESDLVLYPGVLRREVISSGWVEEPAG
jgi:hypothetical protein